MTPELDEALSFCYALLGAATVEEAANVWTLNPDARMAAHRAIYEHNGRDEPYETMMARMGRSVA